MADTTISRPVVSERPTVAAPSATVGSGSTAAPASRTNDRQGLDAAALAGAPDPQPSSSGTVPPSSLVLPKGGADPPQRSTLAALDQAFSQSASNGAATSGATDDAAVASAKQQLLAQARAAGATDRQQAVILAMAMRESTTLAPGSIDAGKSGNTTMPVGPLRVSPDLLRAIDPACDPAKMQQPQVVAALVRAMNDPTIGEQGLLRDMRGGNLALGNGRNFGADAYCQAIGDVASLLQLNPAQMTDGRIYRS